MAGLLALAPHMSAWAAAVGIATTAVVLVRVVVEERLLRERYRGYGGCVLTAKALIPFVA